MFIRCKQCHSAVWVEASEAEDGVAPASCRVCGQEYSVGGITGRAGQELAQATRRLAGEQQIDLPGAYSVALKIMDLEGLREVSRSPAKGASAIAAAVAESPRREFDPAFQASIEAGLMSPTEAARRGVRDTYAKTMMKRFDLPINAAYALADNRVSMLEALRGRGASRKAAVRVDAPRGYMMRLVWLVVAFVLVAIVAGIQQRTGSRSPAAQFVLTQIGDAEVRKDGNGRLYQVRGPDPRSVLRTFCVAGDRPLQAVATVPSNLPGSRDRLGLVRDPANPSVLSAIEIREDVAANGWVAGEPGKPLIAGRAPDAIARGYANGNADSDESSDNAGPSAPAEQKRH